MLPVVVVLGVFTVVRLVDTGVQNVQVLAGIARHPPVTDPVAEVAFFPEMGGDVLAAGLAVMGLRRRRLLALFTAASMVSAINSVVAGVGVALRVTRLAPRPVAIGAGALLVPCSPLRSWSIRTAATASSTSDQQRPRNARDPTA